MKKTIFTLAIFSMAFILLQCQPKTLDIVKTNKGEISGYKSGEVHIFKGIPFAAPPVGDLRWQAPQEHENWEGVKECKTFSASPIQRKPEPFFCWSEEFIAPPVPLSEDCLYLNVWSAAQTNEEKRPVFVWIYGGGFNSGSAACAIYDGEEYAKRGVVFVSINYRVGPFGFMAHPELSTEQNGASGNYGLMDQIAALKWVKDNIQAFGGDPENVTIAGQSAGSMSVNSLVASPLAKGLFQKAIGQSGGLLPNRVSTALAEAEKGGLAFQAALKVENLDQMRKIPAGQIQETFNTANVRMSPISDNYVLPTDLKTYFAERKHNDVPTLTGWVTGDGALRAPAKMTLKQYDQFAKKHFGKDDSVFLALFTAGDEAEVEAQQNKLSLLNFAVLASELWAEANSSPSYLYEVTHVPTDKPDFPNYGAFHTSEVPYALHNLHTWQRPWEDHDFKVEATMSSYWLNFIKTGNPNGENLPQWNAFSAEKANILQIDEETKEVEKMYKSEIDFLKSHH